MRNENGSIIRYRSQRWTQWALGGLGLTGALFMAGCDVIAPKPELEPTPPPPAQPKPDVFDPTAGVTTDATKVVKRNDRNEGDSHLPEFFRVQEVVSGELLRLYSVTTRTDPATKKVTEIRGVPDTMRLAGIITVPPGKPGFAETVARIQRWTLGQELDVEQDARFPTDINNRPLIQVHFKGREGQTKDTDMLLNRMLVRLGYAVVDVYSPTSIDVKPWLNDEQFARNHKLGLWGKGIILGQRPPLPRRGTTRRQDIDVHTPPRNEGGAPAAAPAPGGATGMPGAPDMPPGAPPGMPGAPGMPPGAAPPAPPAP